MRGVRDARAVASVLKLYLDALPSPLPGLRVPSSTRQREWSIGGSAVAIAETQRERGHEAARTALRAFVAKRLPVCNRDALRRRARTRASRAPRRTRRRRRKDSRPSRRRARRRPKKKRWRRRLARRSAGSPSGLPRLEASWSCSSNTTTSSSAFRERHQTDARRTTRMTRTTTREAETRKTSPPSRRLRVNLNPRRRREREPVAESRGFVRRRLGDARRRSRLL